LQQVLDSLQRLADQTRTAPTERPTSPPDRQRLQALLTQLATALELSDPEQIEPHLKALGHHLDSTRFQNIANQIAAYDYDEALKTLKGIARNLADRP
jgi:hypothetical protein